MRDPAKDVRATPVSDGEGDERASQIVNPPAAEPASRPMTSTTITCPWLSAVECRRSMASGEADRGVENKRAVGTSQIVVDRFWHADQRDAEWDQLAGDAVANKPTDLK
jgi:hypothetical protein